MPTKKKEDLYNPFQPDDAMISRFAASEAYRVLLVETFARAGRWQDLGVLLCALQKTGMSFWADYFCAALDECIERKAFEAVRSMVSTCDMQDYTVLLELRECAPGSPKAQEIFARTIHFLSEKPAGNGYYYRMAALAEAFRLGLDAGEIVALMDLDAVDYLVSRLAVCEGERFCALRSALEAWQAQPREDAGEIERYLAMRMAELVYQSHKQKQTDQPSALLKLYHTALERRFSWETEHRAAGMCVGGGSVALPAYVRAICYMHEAFRLEGEGHILDALVALRSAILLDLTLAEVADALGERLVDKMENRLEGGRSEEEDYEETLRGIKLKIELLIEAGFPQEVISTIRELERMMPGDEDIYRLKVMAGLLPPS